jgi:hypothetical protein
MQYGHTAVQYMVTGALICLLGGQRQALPCQAAMPPFKP